MFTGCICGYCIIPGYEAQGTKCALLNLHANEQKICYRKKASRQPGQGKPQPTCKPKGKEKSRLAQGQDLEEEGPHEEVTLFTSLYAGDEEAGSKTEKDPPEALPEAPGAILPELRSIRSVNVNPLCDNSCHRRSNV